MAQTVPVDIFLGASKTGVAFGSAVDQLDGSTVFSAFSVTGWYEAPATSGAWHHAGVSFPDAGGVLVYGLLATEYGRFAVSSSAVGSVTGSVGSVTAAVTVGTISTDAVSAAAVSAAAVTKIQTGLATPTNITAGTITNATNVTNPVTVGTINPNVVNASALATDAVSEIVGAMAVPPTVGQIETQLSGTHGAGAWSTATGFATPTNVTSAQTAITAAITALNNLSQAQAQTAASAALTAYDGTTQADLDAAKATLLTAIAALPNAAAVVTAVFAHAIATGKTFEAALLDMWSTTVGNAQSDNADAPTLDIYSDPTGATRITHTLTPTTRVVS